jgi:hypothetical protein
VAARLLPHPRYLLRGGLSRQPVGASSTLETALRGLRRTTYVAVDHHRGLLVCVLRLVCVDDEVALHHASVVRPCKDRASDGATRRRRSAAELQLGHPHLARALLGVLDHRDDRRRGESLTAGVDRGAGGPLRSEVPVADSERGAPLAAETLQAQRCGAFVVSEWVDPCGGSPGNTPPLPGLDRATKSALRGRTDHSTKTDTDSLR